MDNVYSYVLKHLKSFKCQTMASEDIMSLILTLPGYRIEFLLFSYKVEFKVLKPIV